ncbi:MAG TPA: LLM class F420-dependent oxidoreductase [Acidimicrobiaceae bacterium]|nr:LLM class F420-dependent oxidoreductase [Acidimicrobiaceae bacterium]
MKVSITAPTDDPTRTGPLFAELESVGYDRAFTFEAKHDPFLPCAVAAQHTKEIELGTAIAIGFARTPMTLANLGWDLQAITEGRFALGIGTQIAPHITQRFSMPWSNPVGRLREMVVAIRAIWECWQNDTPLDHRGEHYTHTRMVPAFNPGPLDFPRPPILTAGFGPAMTAIAGEVADGFLVHPLNTRRSLLEVTLPALQAGCDRVGRDLGEVEITAVTIVVTGSTEEQFLRSREAVRQQLAFYGTTPAYAPVFELSGRGDLHPELKRRAALGEWEQMSALIDDEFLEEVAVVGEPAQIASQLRDRLAGITNSVSLVNNRAPDPEHFASIVADLHTG